MFQIHKVKFLRDDSQAQKMQSGWYWVKLTIFFLIISIVFILIFSKFILKVKIYIPSFFIGSQVLYYQLIKIENLQNISNIYDLNQFLFYLSMLIFSLPLFIFSYYKLGKNYTMRSIYFSCIFTVVSTLFCFKTILNWSFFEKIDFQIAENPNERINDIKYYFVAILSGLVIGFLVSLLWANQINSGGLDYIYTYFSVIKRQNPKKVSFPINLIFVSGGILISEMVGGNADTESINWVTFLLLVTASLIYGFSQIAFTNHLYPKFTIVNLWIVSIQAEKIEKALRTYSRRGGIVLESQGLFDKKKKKIISTAVTYVEKEEIVELIKKIDKNFFLITHPISGISGKFNYPFI